VAEVPTADDGQGWRTALGLRLLRLTFGLTLLAVVFFIAGLGSKPGWASWVVGPSCVAVLLALTLRRQTSHRQRAIGVIVVLLTASLLGYVRFGHTPGPALGLVLAVVVAGLLLGRRAAFVVVAAGVVAVAVVATAMVRGTIAPPSTLDLSPVAWRIWLRTTLFTAIVAVLLVEAMTWVVATIEQGAARAELEATRRHDAERKALEAQQAELMGQIAAGLAHDVNNHLAVVSMWTSVLLASRAQEDLDEAADEIEAAIEEATTLTRRVLVLGRRGVNKPRPLSLTALVDEHAAVARRVLGARVALTVERPPAPAWCHADDGLLGQVLLNLVMNAREALPEGGAVTIRTGTRSAGGRSLAFFEVEDNGVGMSEDVRRRAAEPFFTTKPPGKGSGLGLAAVTAIARQCDGELTLVSSPGAGTRAAVELPAIAAPTAPAEADAAPVVLAGRVLLVDDSASLVNISRQILQEAGCTVVVASDGDEAIARIDEGSFDLLCSDVVMPGRPVREVIDAFERQNPGAPVLLCSGYVGEHLVRAGIEVGAYRFLPKPFGPAQLVAEVAELLRAARPASARPAAVAEVG
jgi:signal transduction histidine kinase/CheY-like chemotaxis protein